MQRSRNSPTRASQVGRGPGAAAVARAEAVAAAALAVEEAPAGKTANPLLSLARTLVRHAKVGFRLFGASILCFTSMRQEQDSVLHRNHRNLC